MQTDNNPHKLCVEVLHGKKINFYEPADKENFCSVTFERTLRIPQDGKVYPLPPSLGSFPIEKVDDYLDRVPEAWKKTGGVFFPMMQREAMWMNFEGNAKDPKAMKIGVGKVNAINGDPNWTNTIEEGNYVNIPKQPWLDGINSGGDGNIKQFVAMPLGSGYSVEAQVTGKEEFGGIQIIVFDSKKKRNVELTISTEQVLRSGIVPMIPVGPVVFQYSYRGKFNKPPITLSLYKQNESTPIDSISTQKVQGSTTLVTVEPGQYEIRAINQQGVVAGVTQFEAVLQEQQNPADYFQLSIQQNNAIKANPLTFYETTVTVAYTVLGSLPVYTDTAYIAVFSQGEDIPLFTSTVNTGFRSGNASFYLQAGTYTVKSFVHAKSKVPQVTSEVFVVEKYVPPQVQPIQYPTVQPVAPRNNSVLGRIFGIFSSSKSSSPQVPMSYYDHPIPECESISMLQSASLDSMKISESSLRSEARSISPQAVMSPMATSASASVSSCKSKSASSAKPAAKELSLSTGGTMKQEISVDENGVDFWDQDNWARIYVRIVNSEMYEQITGKKAPETPVSAQTYSKHNYPWYDVYDENPVNSIKQSDTLNKLKTVREIDEEQNLPPQQDDSSISLTADQVKMI